MTAISLSLTLLVILLALFVLTRIKAGNHGALLTWMTYFVLVIAAGMMAVQVSRVCGRMWHRQVCPGDTCTAPYHIRKQDGRFMHHGMHGRYDCCMEGPGMRGGLKLKSGDDENVIRESTVDTVDGKIMIKETEIIKK